MNSNINLINSVLIGGIILMSFGAGFITNANIQHDYKKDYSDLRNHYVDLYDNFTALLNAYYNNTEYQAGYKDGYAKGLQNVTVQNIVTNNITTFNYTYENNSFKTLVNVSNVSIDLTPLPIDFSSFTLNGSSFTIIGSFQYHFDFNTTSKIQKCSNTICSVDTTSTLINDTYIELYGQLDKPLLNLTTSQIDAMGNGVSHTFVLANKTHSLDLAVYLPMDVMTFFYFLNIGMGGDKNIGFGQYGYINAKLFKIIFFESSLTPINKT